VKRIELYGRRGKRPVRKLRTLRPRRRLVVRLRPGRWRLYTRATDAAGNVEPRPRRADTRVRVKRRH
jgi:hypothetical protein